jgi:hypothetical protein
VAGPQGARLTAAARYAARGVVICSTVDPADYFVGLPLGVYHPFDYPFYYFDVRANAAGRIKHYLAGIR